MILAADTSFPFPRIDRK